MAYSVEKDVERMDKIQKAKGKAGKAKRAKAAAKKKAKAKGEKKENWADRLKRNVQMMLKGSKYKVPAKKKNNPKGKSGGY
jgi:uncharacterized protein Yka (UPF0111/DUF47 family)